MLAQLNVTQNTIWGRSRAPEGAKLIKRRNFMLLLSAISALGIFLDLMVVEFVDAWSGSATGTVAFIVAAVVIAAIGYTLIVQSDTPGVSAFGSLLISAAIATAITLALHHWFDSSANKFLAIMFLVVTDLGLLSYMNMKILTKLNFFCVAASVIALGVLTPEMGWIDWALALIAAAVVMLDFERAQDVAYTVDTAMDGLGAMVIDLFVLPLVIVPLLLDGRPHTKR